MVNKVLGGSTCTCRKKTTSRKKMTRKTVRKKSRRK